MQDTMDIMVAAKILKNLKEEKKMLEESFKRKMQVIDEEIEEVLKEF